MPLLIYVFLLFAGGPYPSEDPIPDRIKTEIVAKINAFRAKGCTCGGQYMHPAPPLKWDNTLYKSALHHAKDMHFNNFFDHFSSRGQDIGQRLDRFGYYWQHAGENLGEGQASFDEVMKDWKESPSHCKMLMNPEVKEVAVARFKRFWVQHFGTKIPEGAVRGKRK